MLAWKTHVFVAALRLYVTLDIVNTSATVI